MMRIQTRRNPGRLGITAHLLNVAEEIASSGLYESLQYPFSYLSNDREILLVKTCAENHVGFIAMKGLAGGLINNYKAAYAYAAQFDNVLPIWGIQRERELDEWLSCFSDTPSMTPEISAFIEADRRELSGDFCRGCGYCMPCTVGITINQCARMSQMIRRAPSAAWLNDYWRSEMKKIETCIDCRKCVGKCPYGLDTPNLLRKNYEDYKRVLTGEISISQ